jgi:arsenate reductase
MAEGFLNHLGAGRFEARSAGTEPGVLNPLAVQVMAEQGIDISGHHAKSLDAFLEEPFDYVVTVCDDANEACPLFPNARRRLHWSFPDPSRAEGTREECLSVFRAVRDAIRARVEQFVATVPSEGDRLP